MKVELIDAPVTGTWTRECELKSLSDGVQTDNVGFRISFCRKEDDTYWILRCEHIIAYKVISEEFIDTGYLMNLPVESAFFEIYDSPWIQEFERIVSKNLDKCKHYVLKFCDETVEIIAQKFIFEQLKRKT